MTDQKHLLLDVPNYDRKEDTSGAAPSRPRQPRTYLQLGAYPREGSDKDRGDDLLDAVGLTTSTDYYFKDDYRHRNGQQHPSTQYWRDDGHVNEVSDPVSLTRQLRTRGGWRLHTDGNYISTTRGDRVDVIGGNYKLAVIGRMNEPGTDIWGESYLESSGGHNRDATNTPGDMVMVAWNPARGTWRTSEETVKGDTIARYQGITREFYECDTMLSKVGSADPGATIPVSETSNTDGAHAQTDFATQWINPSSGAGTGWPRTKVNPTITETVRAQSITENTTVETGTITETTNVRHQKEKTTAIVINEATTVEAGVTITDNTGSEASPVQTFKDTLLAGAYVSIETYLDKGVGNAGGTTYALDVQGLSLDLGFELTLNLDGIGFSPTKFAFDFMEGEAMRHVFGVSIVGELDVAFTLASAQITAGMQIGFTLSKDEFVPSPIKSFELTLLKLDLIGSCTETIAVKNGNKVAQLETSAFYKET